MSDENIAGDATPPNAPAASGAFDWLRESHQQSAPLAPLSDDVPSAAPAVTADPNSAVPADQPQPWAPSPAVPAAAPPQAEQPVQFAPPPQHPLPPVQDQQPPQPLQTPQPLHYTPTPPSPAPLISPADPTPVPPIVTAPPIWDSAPAAEVPAAWPSTPQPSVAAPPTWTPAPPPAAATPPTPTPPAWDLTPTPTSAAEAPSAPAPSNWTSNPEPAPAAPPSWGSQAADPSPPAPQVPLIPRPSFMSAPEHQPLAAPAAPVVSPFSDLTAASVDSTPQSVAPTTFAGGFGLERHQTASRSGNGPLDWAALVLAIVAPPLGIVVAIVALVVGSRTKGFAAGVAKAALGIAIVLSIVLSVGYIVVSKLTSDQANHDAIAASSQTWCTQLKADPATLGSDTYGWPAPGKTIPDTMTSIQAYVTKWAALEKAAPKGIHAGTAQIEGAAKQILADLTKSETLDDATNVQDMRSAVSTSQVGDWVKEYCK